MSRLAPFVAMVCIVGSLSAAGLGCHVAGCAEGDAACAQATTDPATTDDAGSTAETSEPTTIGTTGPGTDTTSPPPTETGETTMVAPAECGNMIVEAGEDCDDGNDADDDGCIAGCVAATCGDGHVWFGVETCDDSNGVDADDCTNACQLARCGDGVVHAPLEKCDAGAANSDTTYDGCNTQCQLGPRCGDGKVNGPESCDDENSDASDGCLEGCVEATSCLQILGEVPDAQTGLYRVWPTALGGNIDVQVWCDMDTDGGGYTFLKIDTEVANASDKGAVAAEALCQVFGMHLLVTRTEGHVASAFAVATGTNVSPIGGGSIAAGTEYLAILAIYPGAVGATCDGGGLNQTDCPGWRAWDDQSFWVTDTPVPGEPSEEHCAGCSMLYKWNPDGTLKSYTTFPSGEGAGTYRFLCDIGDKF